MKREANRSCALAYGGARLGPRLRRASTQARGELALMSWPRVDQSAKQARGAGWVREVWPFEHPEVIPVLAPNGNAPIFLASIEFLHSLLIYEERP